MLINYPGFKKTISPMVLIFTILLIFEFEESSTALNSVASSNKFSNEKLYINIFLF